MFHEKEKRSIIKDYYHILFESELQKEYVLQHI